MSATAIFDRSPVQGATETMLADAPHRIGGVTLVVHDLNRVAEFYAGVIGLAKLDRSADCAWLGAGNATLVTLRCDPTARRSTPRDAALFHTAFLLPERNDLSAWLRHAASLRLPLQGASDYLVSEALYLADPEGNGIEIYVDRPAASWRRDANGIVMATERLDVSALATASDRPWSGFPTGGGIGHVHLRVGEIASSEAFYRDVLGFDVTCRYAGATFFGSGGYHHQLAANVWNSRGPGLRAGAVTGLADVEIVTPPERIEAARQRVAPGIIRAEAAGRLTLVDPWGTPITLVAKPRPRSARTALEDG